MTDLYIEYFLLTYLCVAFLTYYIIPDYGNIIREKLALTINGMSNIVAFPFNIDDIDDIVELNENEKEIKEEEKKEKKEVKFEDKYKEQFCKMSSEPLPFTSEELELVSKKTNEIIKKYNEHLNKEIALVKQRLEENDYNNNDQEFTQVDDKEKLEELLEEQCLPAEHTFLKAEEEAKKEVLNERLKRLKNCYVFEKTPLGNVAMCYNSNKDSFEYYSDNTLPYRFLEPIGRKYVLTFQCKNIFVDMDEELKAAEKRADEKQKEDEAKRLKEEEDKKNNKQKRSVFAKLKEYNAVSTSSKAATVGAKTNNIKMPANIQANLKELTAEPEKLLLKEKSNHYTCQGKFANMKILQPVSRKLVDKKYAMTFADFKKLNSKK